MDSAIFRQMCERHDLTYQYSDDGESWRRGIASEDEIRKAAKLVPDHAAIWNSVVDTKIVADHREPFYWRSDALEIAGPDSERQMKMANMVMKSDRKLLRELGLKG